MNAPDSRAEESSPALSSNKHQTLESSYNATEPLPVVSTSSEHPQMLCPLTTAKQPIAGYAFPSPHRRYRSVILPLVRRADRPHYVSVTSSAAGAARRRLFHHETWSAICAFCYRPIAYVRIALGFLWRWWIDEKSSELLCLRHMLLQVLTPHAIS
jgi:hypothetical protein